VEICGRQIRVQGALVRVARLDADKYHFLEDPEPVLDGLRRSRSRVDLFTFIQRVPDTRAKYPYPVEWDNLAVLPVSTFEYWWKKQVDNKTRNMVRKAEKSKLTLREVPFGEPLVKGIWEIYNECPVRQRRRFPHYGKGIETVRREEATFLDSSFFIGAFFGERLIGFAKLVADESRTQLGVMNIVSMVHHRDKAPQNALIADAVRACAGRGIPYLVYSNFAYGKKQRDSLSDFKANNGFKRLDLPRYYVPLTRLGWTAFRLGLHHRFAERVPECVAARFRDLRAAWYARGD
jgi:hypothetical protein